MSLWERIGGVAIVFKMGGGVEMHVKMGLMYMGVLGVVVLVSMELGSWPFTY
jgi:hypothetical protein